MLLNKEAEVSAVVLEKLLNPSKDKGVRMVSRKRNLTAIDEAALGKMS